MIYSYIILYHLTSDIMIIVFDMHINIYGPVVVFLFYIDIQALDHRKRTRTLKLLFKGIRPSGIPMTLTIELRCTIASS